MRGRVLVIAGSDSGGGAGIQADIKTITALGAYAATAITALTAQDTLTVHGILPVPPDFVRLQAETALADLGADAIKTGMLGSAVIVETVAALLAERAPGVPLVVDPVMVAKGGARLLEEDAIAALKRSLLPLASLLMPNLPEAEALTGLPIKSLDEMRRAAEALLTLGVPGRAAQGRTLTRLDGRGYAGDGGRHHAPGAAARRDPAYAWHRLHACERRRGRSRARDGAAGRGPACAHLRAGGNRGGAGFLGKGTGRSTMLSGLTSCPRQA